MAPNRCVLWHFASYKFPCHDPSSCLMYRNNYSMYELSQPSSIYTRKKNETQIAKIENQSVTRLIANAKLVEREKQVGKMVGWNNNDDDE